MIGVFPIPTGLRDMSDLAELKGRSTRSQTDPAFTGLLCMESSICLILLSKIRRLTGVFLFLPLACSPLVLRTRARRDLPRSPNIRTGPRHWGRHAAGTRRRKVGVPSADGHGPMTISIQQVDQFYHHRASSFKRFAKIVLSGRHCARMISCGIPAAASSPRSRNTKRKSASFSISLCP